mgnify:CR=1 FL=1
MTKINVAIVDDNERMIGLLDAILKTDKNIEVIGRGWCEGIGYYP